MKLLIIDIDGSLANDRWRNTIADYDERMLCAKDDKPVLPMVQLLCTMQSKWDTIGLTSRNERWRQLTQRWLLTNNLPLANLYMRPDDDFSQAPEFKVAVVKKLITNLKPNSLLFIDSREDVVQAYKMEGWVALCTHS